MNVEVRELGNNIAIIEIEGDIDIYTAGDLRDAIFNQIDFNNNKIIISLKDVTYIDSSGIGVLITSLSKLKKVDGNMCIIHLYDSVKKVFELTRLTSFFKILHSEEESVKYFNDK